jgi:AcrR family transcriptional regulator
MARKTEKPRAALSREAVLRAGLAIGDAEGLDAISLRRIAADLDVSAMSLYHYVDSKDALLDAMLDLVYGEIQLPDTSRVEWWDGLAAVAHSARQALIAHPAAAAIVASRATTGPNTLRILETILALLRSAGFDAEGAVRISTAYSRFLISLIALEAGLLPELSAEERRQRALRTRYELESLPSDAFPNVIEAAPYLATPYQPDQTFDQGLELLRAGIQAELPTRSRAATRAQR